MANEGDEGDFKRWLREHQGIVQKVARAFTRSVEDREDLTQEILLRVWSSLPSFRTECKASTWIYRIALNRALTWRRDSNSRPDAVPIDMEIAERSIESRTDGTEMVEMLYKSIRAIGEIDRAVILLALDDCSYQEMAEIMGMSVNQIGVRLNRAKKKLSVLMRSEE